MTCESKNLNFNCRERNALENRCHKTMCQSLQKNKIHIFAIADFANAEAVNNEHVRFCKKAEYKSKSQMNPTMSTVPCSSDSHASRSLAHTQCEEGTLH